MADKKTRLVYLLDFLKEHTDDENGLTLSQIVAALAEKQMRLNHRTVASDLKSLISSGLPVEELSSPGLPSRFYYTGQFWSTRELKIMIDALSTSQVIPVKTTREMIGKIVSLAPPKLRSSLSPRVLVSEHKKASSNALLSNIQCIENAIREDKKMAFQILNYDTSLRRLPRRDGEWYHVSPYTTVWMNDRYYLVGFSDKYGEAAKYRIDRMKSPRLLAQSRVPQPPDFDVRDYTDTVVKMYDPDPVQDVTLRGRACMVDAIVDQFGENITLENVTKDFFEVTVRVSPGNTFFGWLFQYAGEIEIAGPENVLQAYRQKLKTAGECMR